MAENTTYTLTTYKEGDNSTVTGKIVFDGTSITAADYIEIDVGFKPRYVRVENVTDRIAAEHWQGMADESCIKTAAAGTKTLEVTGGNKGITLTDRTFQVAQNATLAVIAASKTLFFTAIK
jgi:hypothetical protein